MEDDIDIYEDLPSFEIKPKENVESSNGQGIGNEQSELRKQIAELTAKLEDFQRVNENLKVNLLSLLKTAKAEIARKDNTIDELRKKLDSFAFRRGIFSKNNGVAERKSTCRDSVPWSTRRAVPPPSFSMEESGGENRIADGPSERSKAPANKPTPIPITLFGERLLKRMADEQNTETKDKRSGGWHGNGHGSGNAGRNSACYVAESDKENGSLSDGNVCPAKESRSFEGARGNGSEQPKEFPAAGEDAMNVRSDARLDIDSRTRRKSTGPTGCPAKRPSEDAEKSVPPKRMKAAGEEGCWSVAGKKRESRGEGAVEGWESRAGDSRRSSSERRPPLSRKDPATAARCSRDSNPESKRRGYFPEEPGKRRERGSSKSRSESFRDKAKRYDQSGRSSSEKSTENRAVETSQRDEHRFARGEHRKSKPREYRRDDHRSRLKSTTYARYRNERCSRSPGTKRAVYEDKSERRYNFRGSDADKEKPTRKDAAGDLAATKRSTADRVSLDEKTSPDILPANPPKCSEETRREPNESGARVERTATDKESSRPRKNDSGNSSTELEDGEISSSPNPSPKKADRDATDEVREATTTSPNPAPDVPEKIESAVEGADSGERGARDSASTSGEPVEKVSSTSERVGPLEDSPTRTSPVPRATDPVPDRARSEPATNGSVLPVQEDGEARAERTALPEHAGSEKTTSGESTGKIGDGQDSEDREDRSSRGERDSELVAASNAAEGKRVADGDRCPSDEGREEREPRQSGEKSSKDASPNIQGKIVVFARRKKPVCLANSNASMTVLINNGLDVGPDSSCPNAAASAAASAAAVRKSDEQGNEKRARGAKRLARACS